MIIFFLHVLLLNFNSFLYIPHSVDFFHFWYLLYFQGPSLPFSIASCYGFLFSSFSWHTVSLRFSLQCLVSPRSPTPATCKEPKTPGTARSEAERSAPPRASSRRSALLPRPPCFRPRPAGQAAARSCQLRPTAFEAPPRGPRGRSLLQSRATSSHVPAVFPSPAWPLGQRAWRCRRAHSAAAAAGAAACGRDRLPVLGARAVPPDPPPSGL